MLLPYSLAVARVERLVLLHVDPESMERPEIRVPGGTIIGQELTVEGHGFTIRPKAPIPPLVPLITLGDLLLKTPDNGALERVARVQGTRESNQG